MRKVNLNGDVLEFDDGVKIDLNEVVKWGPWRINGLAITFLRLRGWNSTYMTRILTGPGAAIVGCRLTERDQKRFDENTWECTAAPPGDVPGEASASPRPTLGDIIRDLRASLGPNTCFIGLDGKVYGRVEGPTEGPSKLELDEITSLGVNKVAAAASEAAGDERERRMLKLLTEMEAEVRKLSVP
jgi:hypothetical protein